MDEENGMDSSSSPSGDILTCSRPLIERRLRPQHDQALKCPRCDSTHTKFCYYNNYSLSQPRYFCKTCRRYWTKGGTLRNIPVGGGCRKNKKVSSKKSSSSSNDHDHQSNNNIIINQNPGGSSSTSHHNPTDLQLSTTFPVADMQFSHLGDLMGNHHHHHHHGGGGALGNPNFMDSKYINAMLENPRPIDFMESNKYHKFIGNGELGFMSGLGHDMMGPNFHGLCSPFGMSLDHGSSNGPSFMDLSSTQRLMLPYEATMGDHHHHHHHQGQNMAIDVKPNPKLLSLDQWQDQQACSDAAGKDPSSSFGYFTGLGQWTSGLMNGYGSSTTNPLV